MSAAFQFRSLNENHPDCARPMMAQRWRDVITGIEYEKRREGRKHSLETGRNGRVRIRVPEERNVSLASE